MKTLHIPEKCHEKWEEMTPTQKGAFCHLCAMEVVDFSKMTPDQIKIVLHQKMGQRVCGRIDQRQLDELNNDFMSLQMSQQDTFRYASFFSLLAVFGLMLFSCNSPEQIVELQRAQRAVKTVLSDHNTPEVDEIQCSTEQITVGELIEGEIDVEMVKGNMVYNVEERVKYTETKESTMLLGAMVRREEIVNELTPMDLIQPDLQREYDEFGNIIPLEYDSKVYPNPTVSSSKLELALPADGNYILGLYDLGGRHVRNIHEGELNRGVHTFELQLQNEKPGTFLLIIRSKVYSRTIRILKN